MPDAIPGTTPSPDAPFLNTDAPFLVEHRQTNHTPSGSFRPDARLLLLPALRTGGLWSALPPEDLKNLLLLLTFLTPNGWCRPTLLELAEAMQVSHAKAQARLRRLTDTPWRGQPLVSELSRPDGMSAYIPGRALVAHAEQEVPTDVAAPTINGAGREAVIAHSRAAYAAPRAEVERGISERMGWGPPAFEGEDPAVAEGKRQAFGQMTSFGLPREQALDLLARFDLARIERQLAWLPARHAKSPSRYLMAAVESDYEMPPALRRQALLEAALREQARAEEGAVIPQDGPATEPEVNSETDEPSEDASTIYRA